MSIGESARSLSVRRAPHCLTGSRKSNAHVRFAGAIQAHTVDRTAYSQKVKQGSGNERVLRYPDGRVRCIRYPLTTTDNKIQSDHVDVTVSYEEDWDPDRWDDIDWPWNTSSLWKGGSSSNAAVVTPLTSQPAHEFILQQKVTRTMPQSLILPMAPCHSHIQLVTADATYFQQSRRLAAYTQCSRVYASATRPPARGPEQLRGKADKHKETMHSSQSNTSAFA